MSINSLQKKYASHFLYHKEKMTKREAEEYSLELEKGQHEFKDRMIANLRKYLLELKKIDDAETAWRKENIELAIESRDITERWISLGANFRTVEKSLTIWEYKGVRFYHWFSGCSVRDEIKEQRKADERLGKMIAAEKQTV